MKKILYGALALLLILVVTGAYLWWQSRKEKTAYKADTTNVTSSSLSGRLTFETDASTFFVGQSFEVRPKINTGGQAIYAYVLRVLYDPQKLELVPVNNNPVVAGTLLSTTTDNYYSAQDGKIRFGQTGTTGYNGSGGVTGKINFKVKASGSTTVSYYLQTTQFSNTAYQDNDLITMGGDDILGGVTNLTLTLSNTQNFSLSIKNRTGGVACPTAAGVLTAKATGTNTPIINNAAVTLGANCQFSANLPSSFNATTYDVTVDWQSVLKKTAANLSLPSASTISLGEFIGGDFSNNDCISSEDWGFLYNLWGALPSSTNWNSAYDLKGDNQQIGAEDWSVMYSSWNQGTSCGW